MCIVSCEEAEVEPGIVNPQHQLVRDGLNIAAQIRKRIIHTLVLPSGAQALEQLHKETTACLDIFLRAVQVLTRGSRRGPKSAGACICHLPCRGP